LHHLLIVSRQVELQAKDLWDQRVDTLGLSLEHSPVWAQIVQLHEELKAKGIDVRIPCYVACEWGCPDGQPIIGIPFYLVDQRFHAIEQAYADDLEDADRILVGLRHEAGHALNYAFHLYDDPEWQEVFGSFHREYNEDYVPHPFSRRHVRHLPGWYAQKHPDEDFAETFAVWLTPGLDWRAHYADWEAGRKLDYVDRLMKTLGGRTLVVDPAACKGDPSELHATVAELYEQRRLEDAPATRAIGSALDADLREIFSAAGPGLDAAGLIHDRRQVIMKTVSGFTGSRMYVVKTLLDWMTARVRQLGLRAPAGKDAEVMIGVAALATSLTANFLAHGKFCDFAEAA
jgi:hypothetical protein